MVKHWLAVHWPHPKLAAPDEGWHIFLKKEFKHLAAEVEKGHRVLFYETKKGKRRQTQDGKPIQLKKGRGGIVCVADVIGNGSEQDAEVAHQEYEDGDCADWTIKIPCGPHQTGKVVDGRPRIVPRAEFAAYINQPKTGRFTFRGGLLEISPEQFKAMFDMLAE